MNRKTLLAPIAALVAAAMAMTFATSSISAQTATPPATTTGTVEVTGTATVVPTSDAVVATATAEVEPTDEVTPTEVMTSSVPGSITVDGIGRSSATPDSAVVEIGVQTRAITASNALSETSVAVTALVEALTAAGVDQADIQTQNVSLFPIYDQPTTPNGTQVLSGFNATNVVQVRVRSLDDLGDLLDTAVGAGANLIQSIRLELSDAEDAVSAARAAAVANARAKAEELATLTGRKLGAVRAVVESTGGAMPFAAQDGRGGAASVPIEPGSQSVQVTVQVTWELQ